MASLKHLSLFLFALLALLVSVGAEETFTSEPTAPNDYVNTFASFVAVAPALVDGVPFASCAAFCWQNTQYAFPLCMEDNRMCCYDNRFIYLYGECIMSQCPDSHTSEGSRLFVFFCQEVFYDPHIVINKQFAKLKARHLSDHVEDPEPTLHGQHQARSVGPSYNRHRPRSVDPTKTNRAHHEPTEASVLSMTFTFDADAIMTGYATA